jgi:peptide chain release factor 1
MAWPKDVRRTDLRVDFYRGSGPSGQNRNKRDTACRIMHLPTGTVASAQDERTQEANRRLAFRRLAAKLEPLMRTAARAPREARPLVRVRTYNALRGAAVDHRAPGTRFDLAAVMDGALECVPGCAAEASRGD